MRPLKILTKLFILDLLATQRASMKCRPPFKLGVRLIKMVVKCHNINGVCNAPLLATVCKNAGNHSLQLLSPFIVCHASQCCFIR